MYVRGKHVILAMGAIGIFAACMAVWLSYQQFARMTQHWGRPAAELIHHGPIAEIWRLVPAGDKQDDAHRDDVVRVGQSLYLIAERKELHDPPGFINLRRALLEERAFDWTDTPPTAMSTDGRVMALAFRDGKQQAILVIDLGTGVVRLVGTAAEVRLIPNIAREFTLFADGQFPAKRP